MMFSALSGSSSFVLEDQPGKGRITESAVLLCWANKSKVSPPQSPEGSVMWSSWCATELVFIFAFRGRTPASALLRFRK